MFDRRGFLDSDFEFFVAPPKYLGSQLASYGQLFSFDIGFESDCGELQLPNATDNVAVRLKGGNISDFISYSFLYNPPVGISPSIAFQTFTVRERK